MTVYMVTKVRMNYVEIMEMIVLKVVMVMMFL